MSASAPFPLRDAIARKDGAVTLPWVNWFSALQQDVSEAPFRLTTVSVEGQVASVGVTAFPLGALASGLYRISLLARVTTPATTSSSVSVGIGFTLGGVASLLTTAALVANTAGAVLSDTVLVRVDRATPVTYRTTYASVGATGLVYAVYLTIEQVDA